MPDAVSVPPLTLEPIHGPPMRALVIAPDRAAERPVVMGRSSASDIPLADPEGSVSRAHADISFAPGEPFPWKLRDAGSKHGTFVNGQRLDSGEQVALAPGDQVRIGPWVFRVVVGAPSLSRRLAHTSDDGRIASTLMQRVADQPLAPGAQRRLELLMRCAADVVAARDEAELAGTALAVILEGTGLSHGAVIRAAGATEVEIIAHRGAGEATFSRSILQAAADPASGGQTVVLDPSRAAPAAAFGQSVVMLDIAAALCIPIMVERLPPPRADAGFTSRPAPRAVRIADAFLYIHARRSDSSAPIDQDTIAFAQAVARLCGLALSNLHRAHIEQEDHRRRAEIDAARDVQRIIMPPLAGRLTCPGHAGVSYHVLSIPGRFVAGDLFDFAPVGDDHAAVLLGDVVGKGVAAGMVMANVQAHLSRLLRQTADPAATLTEISRLVSDYSERLSAEHGRVSLFVSLFAAVLDLKRRTLTFADAGHGYAILCEPGKPPARTPDPGGTPLGVAPDSVYENRVLSLAPGARLVIFSDGLAEQRSPDGHLFGIDRAAQAVLRTTCPAADTAALVAALREHAAIPEPHSFADDVTVASIALE